MSTPKPLPLQSRKFLAYLVAEISWKIVLAVALFVFHKDFETVGQMAWWFMISIVVTAGFTEIGYIGGQAWLDRYVKVAELAKTKDSEEG